MNKEPYQYYFDIDPDYFPVVNANVIKAHPDLWKKFYPHETFVQLLKDTLSVLTRKNKLSIWVEGAYGTGKSHAVLTLKKLLDAAPKDAREYFDRFSKEISSSVRDEFLRLKSPEEGKILTIHRYGSSEIKNDDDLFFAIQESVLKALDEAGLPGRSEKSIRGAVTSWLEDPTNRGWFDAVIREKCPGRFGNDSAETVLQKLKTYEGDALQLLIGKIRQTTRENGMYGMNLNAESMKEWILSVIAENRIKAIIFIWDEFSDFFDNVHGTLTGFQNLAELSETGPFYFVIVTHKSGAFGAEINKIANRFISPTCKIELPENMAFRLMGAAMEKKDDPMVRKEWDDFSNDLYERTRDARNMIMKAASINEQELRTIIPIHPYAALLLKYIATAFDANQRSMFDFIKNDRGEEIKGFQWFIKNYSPFDDNPLLTIDMLWDFFYEKNKGSLTESVRSVLDHYALNGGERLTEDEQRVYKTVLLMQAMSAHSGGIVKHFIPTQENLNYAFIGSDFTGNKAANIADKLVFTDKKLCKIPIVGGAEQYSALISEGNSEEIQKKKEQYLKTPTADLISRAGLEGDQGIFTFTGFLRNRFILNFASETTFDSRYNTLRNEASGNNQLPVLAVFAKDDAERSKLLVKIRERSSRPENSVIFIDAAAVPFGSKRMEQYAEEMANYDYWKPKNKTQADARERNAKEILKKWKNEISFGDFAVYAPGTATARYLSGVNSVMEELEAVDKREYPQSPETIGKVIDGMWVSNSLAQGVKCGASHETKGTYHSANASTKLENFIGDAWETPEYWKKNPYHPISKMKIALETQIQEAFENEGRIALSSIWETFADAPYGFTPCNLSAFLLGFLMSEYKDGRYTWTNGMTSAPLTLDKLAEALSGEIKQHQTPTPKYREQYIVSMTDEEKAFHTLASEVFGIPKERCTSVEETRKGIRTKMESLTFPIWCLRYSPAMLSCKTPAAEIQKTLEDFHGLTNNANAGGRSETDIAMEIGRIRIRNEFLGSDLRTLVSVENCKNGMQQFLERYHEGELIRLAKEIDDGGQYINRLQKKFDANSANWLWNEETAYGKIDELILEYRIIAESNHVLPKTSSFSEMLNAWGQRLGNIRMSFAAGKSAYSALGLSELMEELTRIKRTNTLPYEKRSNFLELLRSKKADFTAYYEDQIPLFRDVCGFSLSGLESDDFEKVYQALPTGCLTLEKNDYLNKVEDTVKAYKSKLGSVKLKTLWKEKTGTNTPRDWSSAHKMPILCMVPAAEQNRAKSVFATVNSKHPDEDAVQNAINYLESAEFLSALSDPEARDRAFRRNIIKQYDILLTDVNEARDYLSMNMGSDPDNWLGMSKLDSLLNKMAETKYAAAGHKQAQAIIDEMDPEELKSYLKELIKDNFTVGSEIIRTHK